MGDSAEDSMSGSRLTDRVSLGVITRLVDRDLVDEVLGYTGKLEKRSRLLPARVVVYYVLALTLFFGDAYEEVMRKLVNGLRFLRLWDNNWKIPTAGAISQARARLSEEPLKELYFRVAQPMATPGTIGAWYNDLRVMAIDGTMLEVPDTPANAKYFGKRPLKHLGNERESPYPQARLVGLAECGTHAIIDAAFGPWKTDERTCAVDLLRSFTPDMLIIADRGFYSYDFWVQAADTGANLLWRMRKDIQLPVQRALPDGSYLTDLLPSRVRNDYRRGALKTIKHEYRVPVRVIEYTTSDTDTTETYRLITTLLDHETAPAAKLAELYHQRWEFENTLAELKTHQMDQLILRSKKPELVNQEIWGLLITHYAIRDLMRQAADNIGIDPDRLSFTRSLNIIRRDVTNGDDFSP